MPQSGRLAGIAMAAGDGIDPRQKFGKGEGLDQIIVAAALQAFDPVIQPAHGGEKQHRRLAAFGSAAAGPG